MIEDWKDLIGNMNDVMKSFSDMARAAHAGGALESKAKELIALAISVAIRRQPCIAYHIEGAVKAGASREEISETLAMAVYMGAGPSVMYAAHAIEAFDQLSANPTS